MATQESGVEDGHDKSKAEDHDTLIVITHSAP